MKTVKNFRQWNSRDINQNAIASNTAWRKHW